MSTATLRRRQKAVATIEEGAVDLDLLADAVMRELPAALDTTMALATLIVEHRILTDAQAVEQLKRIRDLVAEAGVLIGDIAAAASRSSSQRN